MGFSNEFCFFYSSFLFLRLINLQTAVLTVRYGTLHSSYRGLFTSSVYGIGDSLRNCGCMRPNRCYHRTVETGTKTKYLNINMLLFGYGNCKLNFASSVLLLDAFKFTSQKRLIIPSCLSICLNGTERMVPTNSREISCLGIFFNICRFIPISVKIQQK